MTNFKRRGHWRTSKYGAEYWVRPHNVDRTDWNRESGSAAQHLINSLIVLRAYNSHTAQYVKPNAKCPVCEEPVFFYRNQHGSKVFFDELGPPWPKHPCTDQPQWTANKKINSTKANSPHLRLPGEIDQINYLWWQAGISSSYRFELHYESKPWRPWVVERILKTNSGISLILSSADFSSDRLLFLASGRLPRGLRKDALVFYRGGKIEYLCPKSLKVVNSTVERLSGASAFIASLIE